MYYHNTLYISSCFSYFIYMLFSGTNQTIIYFYWHRMEKNTHTATFTLLFKRAVKMKLQFMSI